ncbi:tetratricopeptide repeat protein [Thalassotalea atypica]|uniref:tetratricopeptide repeat protein n=1 Tax=Thalassotalea atypica TaxID=2054316 RepID=UPI00257342AA|nr:tetratricopeptide repeat protein [Thalassotalea atypica]
MTELLLSEISESQDDLLRTFSLIEEFIFDDSSRIKDLLEPVIANCQEQLAEYEDQFEQAEHLINTLYVDHLFLDNERKKWPSLSFQLASAFENRMMFPILKAAIIQHIATECGFESDLVFVPEKTMVRLVCNESYAIIFDPLSGESLNFHELDTRMEELSAAPEQYHLAPMDVNILVVEYLTACKNALIGEENFNTALRCVDLLVSLRPEDPLERRDRGFLLHQLDCFKVACDDYRFFVEQCPEDPAAQLLKIQLDNIKITNTVIH